VVIVRGPRSPDVFSYTDAQWVKVVAAHPACNQHQLLVDLEAAGQRYQAGRRDSRLRLQVRVSQARAALIRDALWAWSKATGDTELKVSRVHHSLIEYGPADRQTDPLPGSRFEPDPGRRRGRTRGTDQSNP